MPFTAIVTGGSGIVGGALVEHLARNPHNWKTIHAVSRTQKEQYPPHVKHHSIDLLSATISEIAEALKKENVVVDYVFFAAYKQDSDLHKMCDTNGKMLDGFLRALQKSQPNHPIRRVVLTTGAKHYGVHLGATLLPCMESDPRVDVAPNFYYTQEDILEKVGEEFGWEWNVCRPGGVLGAAKGNFMNLAVTMALYASVQKELGEPLWFPGNEGFYRGWDDASYAPLVAEFEEWVALHPDTANEAGIPSPELSEIMPTWSRLWPCFSEHFGVPIPPDHFSASPQLPNRIECPNPAPLARVAQSIGLPPVPNGVLESRVSLVKWSKLPKVRQAWGAMVTKHGLDPDAFNYATWDFVEFVVSRTWETVLSMSKARQYGWTGFKDTTEAYAEIFKKLEQYRVIPERFSS